MKFRNRSQANRAPLAWTTTFVLWACICFGAFLEDRGSFAQSFTDAGFASELVATLPPYGPGGIVWAPDGRMFVWQKSGVVKIIKNGTLLSTPFLDFSSKVNTYDDRGLWCVAFDPNFSQNGYLYVTYVFEPNGNPNDPGAKTAFLDRVTADPANPDRMLPGSEVVILGPVPAEGSAHLLGTMRFAPDGMLFVGSGDANTDPTASSLAMRAQDLNSLNGKILRIRPDGTAPSDNPFYDGTDSARSKVWCYGVRNPYRFSLSPMTGEPLFFIDVGWNTWEEIDQGVRGGNYGWPCNEGPLPEPDYQSTFASCSGLPAIAPIYSYNHANGDLNQGGTCLVGGDFYTGTQYPQAYQNNYFYGDYSGNWIHRVIFDANGNLLSTSRFATSVAAPSYIEQGPDGFLYYVSFSTGEIRRIIYNGPVAVASATTPSYGYAPLGVSFSSAGSANAGGGTLTYSWDFGDGTTSTAPNPTHTYTATGVKTFTAKLTVKNSNQQTSSSTVLITVGSVPPSPVISLPASGIGYMPGQTVAYQGSASDADDGQLSSASLSWTVLLHHNTHVHYFVGANGSSQGSFTAQLHDTIGTFSYEIVLTATDSSGLSASTSVPVAILPDSSPPTIPLNVAAVASISQISLAWSSSSDNAAVAGYFVERSQGAGSTAFTQLGGAVTGNAFNDTGLAANTTYNYRVRAMDASGNLSGYSTVAAATTPMAFGGAGLVAAYSFNEGNGTTVNDFSGNGNNGTLNGATWVAAGKYGNALSFSGSSRIIVPDSPSLHLTSGMTLEGWVYPAATPTGWSTVMMKEQSGELVYVLYAGSPANRPNAYIYSGSEKGFAGPSALPLNTWSHLAATYDGSTLRLYLNATQAASASVTGNIVMSGGNLSIGGNGVWGEYFRGSLDDLRIYNRALSQSEIQTDMNTPVGGAPPPDTTPPSIPSGFAATAAGSSQVNLSWTASTDNVGVTGYLLERSQGAGSTVFAPVGGTITSATFNDTGLAANTVYNYRIRATDAAGNLSGYSGTATTTTFAAADTIPPSVPTGVTATAASSTQINLSWTASTDNVGVTGYLVERSQGAGSTGFTQIATPPGTTYIDTGRAPNTVYNYRVRATDASGNISGYSAVSTATTPSGSAGSGLVAAYSFNEGSGTTVNDSSGNGNNGTLSGAAWVTAGKYGNALSFDGSSRVVVPDSASLDLAAGMTLEGWAYPTATPTAWSTLMMKEQSGELVYVLYAGSPANQPNVYIYSGGEKGFGGPAGLPLNTWSYLAATYDGSTLRLYLNATQVASASVTGAIVSSGGILSIGGNGVWGEYFRGSLDDLRIYNRALSQSEIQTDMNTPVGGAPPPDTTPPSIPSGFAAAAAGSSQVNLSWTASTDNVGVTGYLLERSQGAGSTVFAPVGGTITSATFNDTGLAANTVYNYRIRATDAAGNLSGYSGTATTTTFAAADTIPPSVPTGVTATAASSTQINLSWTASTDNVGVTGYLVERSQGAGSTSFTQIATPGGTTYNDTGRAPNTVYNYRVRATDVAGNLSGYSSTATTTSLPDTSAPTAPSAVTATAASSTQINLSWAASTDNVGVTGYLVERSQGAGSTGFTQIALSSGTTFNDTGLSAGITYNYRVRATDAAANQSGYSSTATATTFTGSSGLVAAYSFNEGTGTTVTDVSGNGNSGSIGTATWTTSGKYGKALSFNGTSAKITIPDAPSLRLTTGMTLEAWVNPAAVSSAWRDLIYKGNDNYYLSATTTTSSRPCIGGMFGTGTYGELFSTGSLSPNTWTHIAGTYDGATERFYVNGVEVASRSQTGNIITSSNPLQIGGDAIYGQYFNGLIDEIRVYNRALSQTEIQADMNTAITP